MDANLMGFSSFKPARDERKRPEWFDALNVCDGELAAVLDGATTASAVAAIAHEPGSNRLRYRLTENDGLIASIDGVGTKLPAEFALGEGSSGEHQQAAGELVEAMDFPQGPQLPKRDALFFRNGFEQAIIQGRR